MSDSSYDKISDALDTTFESKEIVKKSIIEWREYVEAIIKDPRDDKKIRCDLIAYCKDHGGECTIIDWKYVGKKFYYENYWDQMDRYKRVYNDAQCCSFGPLLSRVLVVAIFPSGRVRTHAYYGGDIN